MKLVAVGMLAVTLAACGGTKEQSYPAALRLICESPVGVSDGPDRAARALAAVERKVTNARARAFMGELASSPTKAYELREAAFEAGFGRCILADLWSATHLTPSMP